MKTRVIFGVCGAAFVILALYVLPPIIAIAAMVLLSVIAAQEFTAAVGGKRSGPLQIAAMILAALTALSSYSASEEELYFRVVSFAAVVVLFCILLKMHDRYGFKELAGAFFGGVVIPYLLMSLIRIFTLDDGRVYILLPLLAAWGSDTCALFAGMKFGKHKLAPVVSPKKTIEGSVGGVAGAVVLCLIYSIVVHFVCGYTIGSTLPEYVLLGLIGSILGQLGDLSFSVVKRGSGIKDYGKIFPGHGGVLDRFDSVIFVAPAMELIHYMFMMVQ